MRFFVFVLLAAITPVLSAQEIDLTPIAPNFCKPGVTNKSPGKGILLEYGLQPSYNVKTSIGGGESSNVNRNSHFRFKFKIPLIHKSGLSVLLGADYQRERFRFNSIDEGSSQIFNSIDADALRTTRLSAYLIKPFNSKYYGSIKIEGSFNGDYNSVVNFDNRYAIYRAAFVFGYKKSEAKEMGIGFMASKGFRNTRVLPFAFYNRTFSRKWGIETVLPVKIKARYNISPKNLLLFGPQFKSRAYSIDIDESIAGTAGIFHMRRSELEFSAHFQHQFSSWTWMEFTAGYRYHFDTRFERKTGFNVALNPEPNIPSTDLITATPGGGPIFKLSFFVSPPRSKK